MSDLKNRMKAAMGASSPSLLPKKAAKRSFPEKEEVAVVLPDIREMISSSAKRLQIQQLSEESLELLQQESEIKRRREEIGKTIKGILKEETGYAKFTAGSVVVNFYRVDRVSLSRDLLMQNGVSPAIIAKSEESMEIPTLKLVPVGE